MSLPVLLLDVDGVVNALSKKIPQGIWPNGSWITGTAQDTEKREFPMLIARQVVEFINELHSSGVAEVRWHTTWQWAARNVAELAGFGTFEVTEAPEFDNYRTFQKQAILAGRPTWWKLPAAERVVQVEKRDLIWVDDDLPYEYMRKAQFDPLLGGEQQVLMIDPFPMTGLVAYEMEKIRKFAATVASAVK